ncbi:MAG: tetraacyldisaccharide 4'-kinase [Pseudomonadota bacterium]
MRAPRFWRTDGVAARCLAPLGWVYAGLGWARWAVHRPAAVPVPVFCVGNATVGGSGKTPIVLDLLARLQRQGIVPFALCRGHGGRSREPVQVDPARHDAMAVGDEALLLARAAPTIAARDRLAGARLAVAAGADAIVLDDGMQYPRLAKSWTLLVVDGPTGFGNGRIVPAGPLREPAGRASARADAVVVVGDGLAPTVLSAFAGPTWRCRLSPAEEAPALAGKRVVAFAGIGRPEKFFATVAAMGGTIVAREAFADHHPFTDQELAALARTAKDARAQLVTTAKDAARLPGRFTDRVLVVPVGVDWDDPARVDRALASVITTFDPTAVGPRSH